MITTRICFVRHGETDWNAEKRIQGHFDIGLNETGRAQAMAMAFALAHHTFAALYASDLERAQQTAQAAATRLGMAVCQVPALRERNYGCFQGLTAAEAAVSMPEAHARYVARDPNCNFVSGETMRDFAARAIAGVEFIVRHHPGQTVLVVTHGGVLDIFYRKATGRPLETPRDFTIPNAALNWFNIDGHGWHVVKWGDRHHLERVLDKRVLDQAPE